jgi:hypothetical protein
LRQKVSRAARAKVTFAERRLLELLVHDTDLREAILPLLEPSDHENLATADLFRAFALIHSAKQPISAETLSEHLDGDEDMLDLAHKLLSSAPKRGKDEAIDAVLQAAEDDVITLRRMAIQKRTDEISRESALAEAADDTELLKELTLERLHLERSHIELRRAMGR